MDYEHLLLSLARENEAVIVMTAENRAAIRNLPSRMGRRFVDVGIAEQTMVGAAAGLALRGRIPIVHALSTFLTLRAFEFIRTDVGIAQLPVKFIGAVPGFLSEANGPTHQALEDIALMRGIPGMRIFCPADGEELVEGMAHVVADPYPWYVRYNASSPVRQHSKIEIGKAETVFDGKDIAILTYGFLVREALRAADILSSGGRSVRLLNMRTLQPVDEDVIIASARDTRLLVTIEDHFAVGGLYSIVAEVLLRHRTPAKVVPIAMDQKWFRPGLLPDVLTHEGFTGEQLATRILDHFVTA